MESKNRKARKGYLGEGADKLEETVLEAGAALGALLLHEGGHRRLGLPDLRHGEGAELVHLHHLWHGREHQHGVHAVAVGRYHLHNLQEEAVLQSDSRCKLLNQCERAVQHCWSAKHAKDRALRQTACVMER